MRESEEFLGHGECISQERVWDAVVRDVDKADGATGGDEGRGYCGAGGGGGGGVVPGGKVHNGDGGLGGLLSGHCEGDKEVLVSGIGAHLSNDGWVQLTRWKFQYLSCSELTVVTNTPRSA